MNMRTRHTLFLLVSLLFLTGAETWAQEANYDEEKVGSYVLPDALTAQDGQKVTTKRQWERKRRPELLRLFRDNVYGVMPNSKVGTSYRVVEEADDALGGKAVRRQVEITFSAGTQTRKMLVLLYLPKGARKCPVFVSPNFQGNATTTTDPAVIASQYSTFERGHQVSRWSYDRIVSSGYGVCTFHYFDVYPDKDGMLGESICPLLGISSETDLQAGSGKAIAAWAWGCSRVLDYLLTLKEIDRKRAILVGHSRLGKTALWCGALDRRFAMVVSNNSGCSGAALSRRNYGETVSRICSTFPWWFCNQYRSYAEAVSALPVDQHELIALIAPRPVYVASAQDDRWADPKGEFLSLQAAGCVYALYGQETLQGCAFPSVNEHLWRGNCGYHIRTGVHDVTDYDWQAYIEFADTRLRR